MRERRTDNTMTSRTSRLRESRILLGSLLYIPMSAWKITLSQLSWDISAAVYVARKLSATCTGASQLVFRTRQATKERLYNNGFFLRNWSYLYVQTLYFILLDRSSFYFFNSWWPPKPSYPDSSSSWEIFSVPEVTQNKLYGNTTPRRIWEAQYL